jgi:hypothetical protein
MTTGNNLSEEIASHLNTWIVKRLPSNEYEHPTQKSPLLHDKALRRCTKIGDGIYQKCILEHRSFGEAL